MLHHRDDLSLPTIVEVSSAPCPTGSIASSRGSSLDSSLSLASSSASCTPLRDRCGFNLTIQIAPSPKRPVTIEAKGHLEPHVSNLPRRRRKVVESEPEPAQDYFEAMGKK
ncbi:hypothetical protein C8R44DRAFT_803618 [Mycena epipterygia]|nr:hypothetical protein C8R44DRAFT_803618 [Mycena epipterygia]